MYIKKQGKGGGEPYNITVCVRKLLVIKKILDSKDV